MLCFEKWKIKLESKTMSLQEAPRLCKNLNKENIRFFLVKLKIIYLVLKLN